MPIDLMDSPRPERSSAARWMFALLVSGACAAEPEVPFESDAGAAGASDAGDSPGDCTTQCARLVECATEPAACPGAMPASFSLELCTEACASGWTTPQAFSPARACGEAIAEASRIDPEFVAACTGKYPTTPGCDALGAKIVGCAASSCPGIDRLEVDVAGFLALFCSDPLQNSPDPNAARLAALDCADPELTARVQAATGEPGGLLTQYCAEGAAESADVCTAAIERMAACGGQALVGTGPAITACVLGSFGPGEDRACIATAADCAAARRCGSERVAEESAVR